MPSFLGYVHVDERYFDTVGLRILSGRDFSATDVEGAEPVGIVSESLARFIARGGNAVGMAITESSRRLARPGPDVVRIIGVVPDVVTNVNALEPLALYYTVRQKPGSESQGLHVRSRRPAADLAGDIRRVVKRIDGRVAPSESLTMRDLIARQMAPQQFGAAVLGALATVALLLTLLGTYVIAEAMAKARERELGVRAALGATARHLSGLIVGESCGVRPANRPRCACDRLLEPVEGGDQVVLGQCFLQKVQHVPDASGVECAAMQLPECPGVFHVLRTPGQHLGNNQVTKVDDGQARTLHVRVAHSREKLILEAGSGDDHIERHSGGAVHERKDPRTSDELRIGHAQGESSRRHVFDEPVRGIWFECQCDVDIGAEPGNAIEDHGLRAKHVPAAPSARDWRQSRQQVKRGGLNRHGEAGRPV